MKNISNLSFYFEETPVNRRLEELRGNGSSKSSKQIAKKKSTNVDSYDCLADIETPIRESIKQVLRDRDNETPETKRRRYEENGIRTPEYATTPFILEEKRKILEERRMRHRPTESQIKKNKEKTVRSLQILIFEKIVPRFIFFLFIFPTKAMD